MKRMFLVFLFIGMANASCVCKCVNGRAEALCDNSFELKPICSATICPLPSVELKPLDTPRLPPIGTSNCDKEQVYNEFSGKYEWKTICR